MILKQESLPIEGAPTSAPVIVPPPAGRSWAVGAVADPGFPRVGGANLLLWPIPHKNCMKMFLSPHPLDPPMGRWMQGQGGGRGGAAAIIPAWFFLIGPTQHPEEGRPIPVHHGMCSPTPGTDRQTRLKRNLPSYYARGQ